MVKPVSILILIVSLASIVWTQTLNDLAQSTRGLMPVPASVSWKAGKLRFTKDFKVSFIGQTDDRLRNYVLRALRRLEHRTVIELPREFSTSQTNAGMVVETHSTGNPTPKLGDDESYILEISDHQARLTASTTVGAMRGIETFLQLLEADNDGFFFPAVSIADKPRFPWRGLLIDSGRHYQPVEVLKRNLDAMAAVKLNVLHWHLTEDQGFRVESKKLPELHRLGSDGLFYTQDEVRDIIRYAADRGIRVMPEFDMPGHATSWLVSHPEIASGPGPYKIERQPGIFDPTMDPTNEKTYKLLKVFFKEMAALFPDTYMHIGGDENEGKQWNANPKIQAFMKENDIKSNHELQTYFNKRILKFLQKDAKIMMGWDEIFQPDLPKDVVIHSWRGQKALAEAAKQGYQGVLSNGYYIDLIYPASDHYAVDPLPANTGLSPEEQKRILGGEATMWSEWVSPETIDSRIWPRTAAIAERLWSPRSVNDVDDMYRRLGVIDRLLEDLGLTQRKNQQKMLRLLADRDNVEALEEFVSVIEPVKEYRRYELRPQDMLAPLTGLIDAARPDAAGARSFNLAVNNMLAGKNREVNMARLRSMLNEWHRSQPELIEIMTNSPALAEAGQLAVDFGELNRIALESLDAIERGNSRDAAWRDTNLRSLDAIAKPKAALEIMIVPGVRKLVAAASVK
jgi:hexosaminidase